MKAICRIDFCYCFVTTNNKLYVFIQEYEKAIEFKRANKGENKKLVNGCQSIYLDIYMNGRRQYEF